jgi:uncharacterized membrane protein YdbT with pleckstrin-like domain
MAKNDFSLLPGEKVELRTHPHWWFFWQHGLALIGVILLLVTWLSVSGSGFVKNTTQWLFLVALIVWAVAAVLRYIEYRTTVFIVTDKRIAYQAGLIRRTGMSIQLNRINNVSYEQGLLERLLGNGTLTIESAAEQGTTVFRNIPHPDETRQMIYREIEEDEQRDSHRDGAAVAEAIKQAGIAAPGTQPAAPAAQPSATDRMAQLQQLHEQGLVSDADFEAKKAEILKDL